MVAKSIEMCLDLRGSLNDPLDDPDGFKIPIDHPKSKKHIYEWFMINIYCHNKDYSLELGFGVRERVQIRMLNVRL